jgi:hypothetical protein
MSNYDRANLHVRAVAKSLIKRFMLFDAPYQVLDLLKVVLESSLIILHSANRVTSHLKSS